jgi:hypothetical protein
MNLGVPESILPKSRLCFSFNWLELQLADCPFSQFDEDLAISRLADQLGRGREISSASGF